MLIRTTLSLALVADSLGLATQGYQVDRFAGRYALGKNLPAVDKKSGFSFNRVDSGEVRVLGGACSEALGGKNLHALLSDGCARSRGSRGCKKRRRPARARAFGPCPPLLA